MATNFANPAITEALQMLEVGYVTAAACVAQVAVTRALADLAVTVKPPRQPFYGRKRLLAFLETERAIDRVLRNAVAAFEKHVCDVLYRNRTIEGLIPQAELILRRIAERRAYIPPQ